jgi:hypothetical protein
VSSDFDTRMVRLIARLPYRGYANSWKQAPEPIWLLLMDCATDKDLFEYNAEVGLIRLTPKGQALRATLKTEGLPNEDR